MYNYDPEITREIQRRNKSINEPHQRVNKEITRRNWNIVNDNQGDEDLTEKALKYYEDNPKRGKREGEKLTVPGLPCKWLGRDARKTVTVFLDGDQQERAKRAERPFEEWDLGDIMTNYFN